MYMLHDLVAAGFLDHRQGRYRIGGEAVKLASSIVARRAFPNVALPVVDALAESTGESAFLAELTADGESIVFIYKADSKNALRFMAEAEGGRQGRQRANYRRYRRPLLGVRSARRKGAPERIRSALEA